MKNSLQQFIVDTLKPYFLDTDLCGINDSGDCEYLTEDGKKCALGKHLKKGEWQAHLGTATELFAEYDMNKILKKSALKFKLTVENWRGVQLVHDWITMCINKEQVIEHISLLEDELKIDLKELLGTQYFTSVKQDSGTDNQ